MGTTVVFLLFYLAVSLYLVRSTKLMNLQPVVFLAFSPIALGMLYFIVLPLHWRATLGEFVGPSDDGRWFGTALILLVAVPTTLIANLVIYFNREKPTVSSIEVPS